MIKCYYQSFVGHVNSLVVLSIDAVVVCDNELVVVSIPTSQKYNSVTV